MLRFFLLASFFHPVNKAYPGILDTVVRTPETRRAVVRGIQSFTGDSSMPYAKELIRAAASDFSLESMEEWERIVSLLEQRGVARAEIIKAIIRSPEVLLQHRFRAFKALLCLCDYFVNQESITHRWKLGPDLFRGWGAIRDIVLPFRPGKYLRPQLSREPLIFKKVVYSIFLHHWQYVEDPSDELIEGWLREQNLPNYKLPPAYASPGESEDSTASPRTAVTMAALIKILTQSIPPFTRPPSGIKRGDNDERKLRFLISRNAAAGDVQSALNKLTEMGWLGERLTFETLARIRHSNGPLPMRIQADSTLRNAIGLRTDLNCGFAILDVLDAEPFDDDLVQ